MKRSRKIIAIIAILAIPLMSGVMAFAIPISELSSSYVGELSPSERIAFSTGFIMGSYASALLVVSWGFSPEKAQSLMITGVWPSDLLKATLAWYVRTGMLKTPLFVAIYRREMDWEFYQEGHERGKYEQGKGVEN